MSDNLALWSSVERTPLDQTKPITGKSYNGNSPKPHHIIKRATETFGPIGIGWGFTIVEDGLHDGATYEDGSRERMHYAKVRVWYIWNNQRGELEHVGGTIFSGKRRNGIPFTDDDAPKKSITDALIKALSLIGFAGDIFLGRYDDTKYMNELREEAAEEKKAPHSPPKPRQPPKAPPRATQTANPPTRADGPPAADDVGIEYVNAQGEIEDVTLGKGIARLRRAHGAVDKLNNVDWFNLFEANKGWLDKHAWQVAAELSVRG